LGWDILSGIFGFVGELEIFWMEGNDYMKFDGSRA
jgi:hypothetical protein